MDSRVIQWDLGVNGNLGVGGDNLWLFPFLGKGKDAPKLSFYETIQKSWLLAWGFVLTLIGLKIKKKNGTLSQRTECVTFRYFVKNLNKASIKYRSRLRFYPTAYSL